MNRICYIMAHPVSPRMRKRIRLVLNKAVIQIISTERQSQDLENDGIEGLNNIIINVKIPSSGKLFLRAIEVIRFNVLLWKEICKFSPDIIYISGYDPLLSAALYKKVKRNTRIVIEFGDIRSIFITQKKDIKSVLSSRSLNLFEKVLFKSVDKAVLTSEKFYSMHFCNFFEKKDVCIVPNIPDQALFDGYKRKAAGEFTIGFIGAIRYLPQLSMLIEASKGLCNLFIAGGGDVSGIRRVKELCRDRKDIQIYGKYRYEKEIANLYGHVDCMYAVYDAMDENCKIALPNKLYESIICEIPIIVADGTYLGELVNKWGVGITVPYNDKEKLADMIYKLKEDKAFYNEIVMCCRRKKKELELGKFMRELRKYLLG